MSGGEGPIGAAKGNQPNTEALCLTPPPPPKWCRGVKMGPPGGGGSTEFGEFGASSNPDPDLGHAACLPPPPPLRWRRGTGFPRGSLAVNVPVLGVIENMSYFICSNCGTQHDIFGHGGAEETAQDFDVPFLGRIPLHPQIRSGSDEGKPVTIVQPEGVGAPYFEIADLIYEKLQAGDGPGGPEITMD